MDEESKIRFECSIELPFFVGYEYEDTWKNVKYNENILINLKVKIRNDLIKFWRGNFIRLKEIKEAYEKATLEEKKKLFPAEFYFDVPVYIEHKDVQELRNRERDLEKEGKTFSGKFISYCHFEETWSVFEIKGEFPQKEKGKYPNPSQSFIKEVFRRMTKVLDRYLLAIPSSLRRSYIPISEGIIKKASFHYSGDGLNQTLILFFDKDDYLQPKSYVKKIYQLGCDSKSIAKKTKELLEVEDEEIRVEIMLAQAYSFAHQRLYNEAIVIACSSVDLEIKGAFNLMTKEKNYTDVFKKLLWSQYRNRYKDIFLKIFIEFGFENISEVDNNLWLEYIKLKDNRSKFAHGEYQDKWDDSIKYRIYKKIAICEKIVKWIRKQVNREFHMV